MIYGPLSNVEVMLELVPLTSENFFSIKFTFHSMSTSYDPWKNLWLVDSFMKTANT